MLSKMSCRTDALRTHRAIRALSVSTDRWRERCRFEMRVHKRLIDLHSPSEIVKQVLPVVVKPGRPLEEWQLHSVGYCRVPLSSPFNRGPRNFELTGRRPEGITCPRAVPRVDRAYIVRGQNTTFWSVGIAVCLFPSERDGASVLVQITSISIEPGVDVEVTINDSQ